MDTENTEVKTPVSTTFTVNITVSNDWIQDGFDLLQEDAQEALKEAILEKMLGYAKHNEVDVKAVKAEVNHLCYDSKTW